MYRPSQGCYHLYFKCTIMIKLQLQLMAKEGHVTNTTNRKCFFNIYQNAFLCCAIFISNAATLHGYDISNLAKSRISNHHIKSNISWVGPLISSNATGNYFSGVILVTFAPEYCCPRFVFLTEPMNNTLIEDGCYNVSAELLQTLRFLGFSSERHMEIDLADAPEQRVSDFQSCTQSKSTGMFTCRIYMRNYLITPRNGSIYAYHPCFEKQSIDFTVHIYLWINTISYQCKALKPNSPCYKAYHCKALKTSSPCYKLYQNTYLPNVFGNEYMIDGDIIFSVVNFLSFQKCHKYVEPFMCRAVFPECTASGPITPCRSMCFEVMYACTDFAKYFLATYFSQIKDFSFAINFICKNFPEDEHCYSKNVTCEAQLQIEHGYVNYNWPSASSFVPVLSTATYECNEDYQLEGNATAVCQYSGEWSTAQCLPISNKRQIIILGATFGAFAGITLITILVVLLFRKEIVVILYSKFGIRFNKNEEEGRTYDAFITYSQEDIGFVKHQLLRPLEELKKFKICIHHRDFDIGVFIATNIINAIKQSRRTIIVLSQSFIDSEWCKFEFEQAHLHLMHDKSYKLLVIVLEEPKNLKNIPPLMQSYILTRTYLMRTDKLFWQKLLYQMPDKKATSEDGGKVLQEIKEQNPGQEHEEDETIL